MNKMQLMRRAAMALVVIAILAAGATEVIAATTSGANQTSPTPVGEPTGASSPPLNPCTLVTLPKAQGIITAISRAAEAPLGPTCVYTRGDGKASITLTVGQMSFAKVTQGLTSTVPLTIGNHPGVCGTRGPQMLYLSLDSNRVLHVTAPCKIAQAIATIAASNL